MDVTGRTDCKTPTLLPTPRVWFVVVACTRYSHCWNVKFIWRATDVPSACSERLCSMEAASKLCGATGLWATRQPAVQNNKVLTNKQLKWNGVKDKVSAAAAVWTLRVCVFSFVRLLFPVTSAVTLLCIGEVINQSAFDLRTAELLGV